MWLSGTSSALLAVAVLVFATVPVSAGCDDLLRSINWDGRNEESYSSSDKKSDFAPYYWFNYEDRAAITKISGDSYLDLSLPKGCWGPSKCGMQGRVQIPEDNGRMVDEATLEFTVRFGKGFDWVRGGKLPGLCGGTCPSGCSSASKSDLERGWSTRIMWTDNECEGHSKSDCQRFWDTGVSQGGMHAYSYFLGKEARCGEEFTFMDGSKSALIVADKDYSVRLYVKLNDLGKSNGVQKLWLNGRSMGSASNLEFRHRADVWIDSLKFDSFFGGSEDHKATRDEHIYIKDLRVWSGECTNPNAAPRGSWIAGMSSPIKATSSSTPSRSAPSSSAPAPVKRAPSSSPSRSSSTTSTGTQYSIDTKHYPDRGVLRTDVTKVNSFSGGFCVNYDVIHPALTKGTCSDYALELNLSPSYGKVNKFTSTDLLMDLDKEGYSIFGRKSGLNKSTRPGTVRSASFCASAKVKTKLSDDQVRSLFTIHAVCNGETMFKKQKAWPSKV